MNARRALFTVSLLVSVNFSYAQTPNLLGYTWWDKYAGLNDLTYDICTDYSVLFGYCSWWDSPYPTALAMGTWLTGNSDLDVGLGPNGEGLIHVYTVDLGENYFVAAAIVWSGDTPCADINTLDVTGYCNTTSIRGDAAILYINSYWFDDEQDSGGEHRFLHWLDDVFVHEYGHTFGLGHNSDPNSVMFHPASPNERFLTNEMNWINATY